eukprot:594152-Hanusia_phi.AAC.2
MGHGRELTLKDITSASYSRSTWTKFLLMPFASRSRQKTCPCCHLPFDPGADAQVYFSKVEPKDPELHLKEPFDWCCSYVWDARGQENDNLSTGFKEGTEEVERLKNKPRHPIPSQPNVHSSEVKKFSDVKPKIDPKLEARILEVTKITRTPAKMKDVDWAFQELETAIESRSSSRITHEMRTMGKMKIFPLILNLTQAPVRLQAALQKIKPLGFEDAMREGEAILENWHLSIGKYMTKQNIVTGDYDGRQQLISLADKANVRKIGLKLAEKFITVKAIPLLSEAIWKQVNVKLDWPSSRLTTRWQLVRVELRLQDLFSKAVDKVSESLTALTADPSSL